MRPTLLLVCIFVVSFGVQESQAAQAAPNRTDSKDRFESADGDRDGRLGREEFFASFPGMLEKAFQTLDTDGDGSVSRAEWEAFIPAHMGTGRPADPARAPARPGGALPLLPLPPPKGGTALPLLEPPRP